MEFDFDEHLEHYECKWCQADFGERYQGLMESKANAEVVMENLRGVIRSYRLYQKELIQENSKLREEVARLKMKKRVRR